MLIMLNQKLQLQIDRISIRNALLLDTRLFHVERDNVESSQSLINKAFSTVLDISIQINYKLKFSVNEMKCASLMCDSRNLKTLGPETGYVNQLKKIHRFTVSHPLFEQKQSKICSQNGAEKRKQKQIKRQRLEISPMNLRKKVISELMSIVSS